MRIEHRGVALAGRLHVEAENEVLAAGKAQRGRLRSESRRHAPACRRCRGRGTCRACGLAPALLEAVVVGERQRLVEHGLELAAVDGGADRGLVRHRLRLDQVAPAQLDRIDAGHARGLVDHPLEACSSPPAGRRRDRARSVVVLVNTQRAAMSISGMSYMPGRQRVKLHGLDVGADRADVGAHAAEVAHAQRQELAALVERELDIAVGVAGVIVAQERLGAVRHPMHRPADLARRHQHREIFRIGPGLQSEGAADILGDDAQRGWARP